METITERETSLRLQIVAAEAQLKDLRAQLANIEIERNTANRPGTKEAPDTASPVTSGKWPLTAEEYKRYGRQMIVPNIGIQGQLRLKAASVLLVGAGGLGCPAAAYISGAGVGTIGIVDGDEVETSNLHRQILHRTENVGMKKVQSAIQYLKALNPNPIYVAHTEHLTPQNAEAIVSKYDLVLDCTDHPTSRYLISDICVLLSKPLISASALRTDGQLIVLNSPALPPGNPAGGPCYRCVFPKPPPAESVVSCGDGGILGPVVGVMGLLQALEAVKIIAAGKLHASKGEGQATDGEAGSKAAESNAASMLLFSTNSNPPFRSVRLRSRRPGCFACSKEGGLNLESLSSGSLDYVLFCGINMPVKILDPEERIEAKDYETRRRKDPHLLVDVREKVQFDICSLEGSVNVPFSTLQGRSGLSIEGKEPPWVPEDLPPDAPLYVVCRVGNDSQIVTRQFKEAGLGSKGRYIGDIKGGLRAWKSQVDSSWPEY